MRGLDIDKLLEIGIALSSERDCDNLLYKILTAAMEVTNCDGGTLYILENDMLEFRVMINKSMDIDLRGEQINLPPVPLSSATNVCSHSARAGKLINISDVYNEERFDFSGTRRYDQMTGYQTVSLLCLPMENDRGELIGVLQLINAKDDQNQTIAFNKKFERVIMSLASQSAICITNRNYSEEITELFDSFVKVMSTAIDARSPYNANHTRNMVKYGENFIAWLNKSGNKWHFSERECREFLMSIWLHDVGKLVTPLEVMDKETRLGPLYERVQHRFEMIGLYERVMLLEGRLEQKQYEQSAQTLADMSALVRQANSAPFIPEETIESIRMLGEKTYVDGEGKAQPWLLPNEIEALSVRRGTLTDKERSIMQNHVEMTEQMLGEMKFSSQFRHVPQWASMHHEFVNGKGYPKGIGGDDLPKEVRLLTILDVFDALTAKDRPYKKPMSAESAFAILDKMVNDGQVDGDILELFKQSEAFTDIATTN